MSFMGASGAAAIASAFVAIRPDGSSFASDLDNELRPGLRGAAERIKESMAEAGKEGGSQLAAGFGQAAEEIQRHALVIGAAVSAAGLGVEAWARSQQDANVELGRLATTTGMTEGELRKLVGELDNVTFSTDDVIATLANASAQGVRSAEDMAHFASTWDLVADATGESVVALSDAGVALRALDIDDPAEALDAFGFVALETTSSVQEFLAFVERTGPQLRELGLDVDDTAAIMGVLERELGLTGRTARSEFRSAVADADGDLGKMLDTLGVSPAAFSAMRAEVEGSGEALERNAQIYADSFTPLQRLQSFVGETMFQFGGLADAAGIAAGALAAMGPAIMAVSQAGPAMGALAAGLGRVRTAAAALRTVMAAHPILTLATVATGVASAFALLRSSSDDTAESVASLAAAMRDAESAMGGLSGSILSVVTDSPALASALAEVGVTANDLADAALNDRDAFAEMAAAIWEAGDGTNLANHEFRAAFGALVDLAEGAEAAIEHNEHLGQVSREASEDVAALTRAHIENAAGMREALTATEDLTDALDEQAIEAAMTEAAMASMERQLAEVEAAADALRSRIDSAFAAGARSILRFRDESKESLNDFIWDLTGSTNSLEEWQQNLTGILQRGTELGVENMGELALAFAELGPEFGGVVGEIADATDGDFLDVMQRMADHTETAQRDMAEEFAKVNPEFAKILAGLDGLTVAEMNVIEVTARREGQAVGRQLALGVASGMELEYDAIRRAMGGAIEAARGAAVHAAIIQSPSRLFAEDVGRPIGEGVAEGILDTVDDIAGAVETLIGEARDTALSELADLVADVESSLAGVWAEIDGRRSIEALEKSVTDAEAKLSEAHNNVTNSTVRVTEAEDALTEARLAAAAAAEEYGEGSREHQAALREVDKAARELGRAQNDLEKAHDAVAAAEERLEDANYRLLKAMGEAFEQGELTEEQFRDLAAAAGLEKSEIDKLVIGYDELREARRKASEEAAVVNAAAAVDAAIISGFGQAVAEGLISTDQLNHLAVYGADDPAFALYLMGQYLGQAVNRRWGGDTMPGTLYEFGEHDRPELYEVDGRNYLLPGNQGSITPVDTNPQMDPTEWGQMAARAYASTLRQLQRAG